MKNLLLTCGLVMVLLLGYAQSASAQNAPGSNGGWWNGNGANYPAWVTNGQVPPGVALWVVRQAQPTYQQTFGLGYLQLVHKYNIGQLTITILTTNPPTDIVFRVSYGGVEVIVLTDSF
jgi:hypothetical protein